MGQAIRCSGAGITSSQMAIQSCRRKEERRPSRNWSLSSLPRRAAMTTLLPSSIVTLLDKSSKASTSKQGDYDRFGRNYDYLDGGTAAEFLGLFNFRKKLMAEVRGDVLEIAAGSLLNAQYYPRNNKVKTITLLEPSREMLSAGHERLQELKAAWPVKVVETSVEEGLSQGGVLQGSIFDTVFETYSLCVLSKSDAITAVSLMAACSRRKLLILDHTLSPTFLISAYQLVTAPVVGRLSKGCRGDLSVDEIISVVQRTKSFKNVSIERYLFGTVTLIVFEF